VSASLPQIDFSRIRQHESSQQRAWEELSYLLVPDIAVLPAGTALERRSAPDGGIEFSCLAPFGKGKARWAWQAKFLFRLDASAFNQMTHSVEVALETTPDLERYTFILPVDRSGRRPQHGRSGEQKWSDYVAKWQASVAARGMEVQFDFIGHSAVVAALQAQKHAGALRYFFDQTLFTDEFFRQQVSREIGNLGERYDPTVHVDLEIGEFFDAVCRSLRFVRQLSDAFREVSRRAGSLQSAPNEDDQLAAAVAAADDSVRSVVVAYQAAMERVRVPDPKVFAELESATRSCVERLEAIEARSQRVRDELRQRHGSVVSTVSAVKLRPTRRRRASASEPVDAIPDRTKVLYDFEARVWPLRRAVGDALKLLISPQVIAARCAALLLDGPAGCGKSHLVADVAKERTDHGMPTLLILGQHLTAGSIWPQIAETIGVDLTGSELLQVLEVAARIRGVGRALIVVDAINEGPGVELWRDRIIGFLRDLKQCPWVAIALTVRDTYAQALLPPTLQDEAVARVTHPGLSGHEEEALIRYAQHYQIRLPDIPPLLPELTNPLFLRSLCRSVNARGLSAIPREAASLAWVFDGLIEDVNRRLSDACRLDVDPGDHIVQRAVQAIAGVMLDIDGEALSLSTARAICDELHPERRRSKSLLEGLVVEGVLLRERTWKGEGKETTFVEQVRFTYQRLADHLRAEVVLDRCSTNDQLSSAIVDLAARDHAWSRVGVIEALVLLVPERRGVELADLLRLKPVAQRRSRVPTRKAQSKVAARRAWLGSEIERHFFSTLIWRNPCSITPKTQKLANRYLNNGAVSTSEWLSLLLSLACIPDHPLNVHRIDRVLRKRMTMPERDKLWSDEVLSIWSEDVNPIARTIDWAWTGLEQPPTDVAQLGAKLLAWLFTSPNRRLRDTATKALLRLVENNTRLLVNLVHSFTNVDEPYIVERLLAVACGHAMRHRWLEPSDEFLNDFADLGRCAFDLAFGGTSTPGHLLIRHYARTCAEVVGKTLASHGRRFDRDLARAQPPYESSWPLTAPSLRELAQLYGRKRGKYFSAAQLLGYDFEHDVVERGIATDFVLPNQARRQASRRTAAQRKLATLRGALIRSVSPRQRRSLLKQLDGLLANEDSISDWLGWEILHGEIPDQEVALRDLRSVAHGIRYGNREPIRPDPDLLACWISERVLKLGWTEERFGARDSRLAYARDAGWPETEPFGRKYAWIAFYEVLGHLTDHCMLQQDWKDSSPSLYEGPWQISGAIDIDPTVLIRGDEAPKDTPAARLYKLRTSRERENAWWLTNYNHTISTFGADSEWLKDINDVPRPEALLSVSDPHGCEWLVLESHVSWRVPPFENLDDNHRMLWVRTQANLVPMEHKQRIGHWAAEQNWMGLWMPTPSEYATGLLGAYPDLPPWLGKLGDQDWQGYQESQCAYGNGWVTTRCETGTKDREQSFPLALATSAYRKPADRDYSANDLPKAILPSPLIIDLLQAHWAGANTVPARSLKLGPIETEYSWLASGELVAFATIGRKFWSTQMLYVRAEPLRRALAKTGLTLWSWVLGEKAYKAGRHRWSSDRTEIVGAVALAPELTLWGLTVEHVAWRKADHEVRKRLKVERPLGRRKISTGQ
jgi:hypothetical protein